MTDYIVKAWRNEDFRASLDMEIPSHPSGSVELSDSDLQMVAGNSVWSAKTCESLWGTCDFFTFGCCSQYNC